MEICFEWGQTLLDLREEMQCFVGIMEKFVLQGSSGGPYPQTHIPIWVTVNSGGSWVFWLSFAVWRLQRRLLQQLQLHPRGNSRWGHAAPGWVLDMMHNPQAQGEVCHRQLDPFLASGISFNAGISGALSLTTSCFHVVLNGQSHHTLLCVQT